MHGSKAVRRECRELYARQMGGIGGIISIDEAGGGAIAFSRCLVRRLVKAEGGTGAG